MDNNNESNKTVLEVVEKIAYLWGGEYLIEEELDSYHEENLLKLDIYKAKNLLGWYPKWGFDKSISQTISWYRNIALGSEPYQECLQNIKIFESKN